MLRFVVSASNHYLQLYFKLRRDTPQQLKLVSSLHVGPHGPVTCLYMLYRTDLSRDEVLNVPRRLMHAYIPLLLAADTGPPSPRMIFIHLSTIPVDSAFNSAITVQLLSFCTGLDEPVLCKYTYMVGWVRSGCHIANKIYPLGLGASLTSRKGHPNVHTQMPPSHFPLCSFCMKRVLAKITRAIFVENQKRTFTLFCYFVHSLSSVDFEMDLMVLAHEFFLSRSTETGSTS